jgi:hypothetical protein
MVTDQELNGGLNSHFVWYADVIFLGCLGVYQVLISMEGRFLFIYLLVQKSNENRD